MPVSEIARRIDEVVKADLATRLEAEGYRKSARTFHRTEADHTKVVNVQANLWNQGSEGSFAINLGVSLPAVAGLSGGPVAHGRFPKQDDGDHAGPA